MSSAPAPHTHTKRPPLRAMLACALVVGFMGALALLSAIGVYALVRGIR